MFSKDEYVCQAGEESYKIFVLIKGMLKVIFPDGKELARVSPVETVGEIGVFTGHKRSASVLAMEESIMLVFYKVELLNLFRNESDLGIQILLNVIQDMARKMVNNNIMIDEMRQVTPPEYYSMILSKKQQEAEG